MRQATDEAGARRLLRLEHAGCSGRSTPAAQAGARRLLRLEHAGCSGRSTPAAQAGARRLLRLEHAGCLGTSTPAAQGRESWACAAPGRRADSMGIKHVIMRRSDIKFGRHVPTSCDLQHGVSSR